MIINKNNDDNEVTLSKYKTFKRCFFSLNGFGMKPPGVNPGIKAIILIVCLNVHMEWVFLI